MKRIAFLIAAFACDMLALDLLRMDIVVNGHQWNRTLSVIVAIVGFVFAEVVMRKKPSTPTRWVGGVIQGLAALIAIAAIFNLV